MIRLKVNENEINFLEGNQENINNLNGALGNVDLTPEEERSLIWLSSWEASTVKNIISAFKKANNNL